MADTDTASGGSPAMDYAEHERTYRTFVALTKWGTLAVVGIVASLALFLV